MPQEHGRQQQWNTKTSTGNIRDATNINGFKQQQGSHSRDASKSSWTSAMTGKPATVCYWLSVTAGMVATAGTPVISGTPASAGKLATGWTPATAGTPVTAEKPRKHGRQPKKRRRNSSNNKDNNIVIGVF
jgi:hypothetical protein